MHYLITGGSGFIGRHLIKALLEKGHGVTYTGRRRSHILDSRAAFFEWDGKSDPPLDSMPRLDGVFHLLGEPVAQRWDEEVKQRIRASRVESTRLLVDGLRSLKHRPSVLVSASAIGFYGERGQEVLTEWSGPGTGFLADVCQEWEAAAHKAEDAGLRVVCMRISVVLGPDGGAFPPMLKLFRTGLGGKLGNGQQWMSWVHVEDLVRLFLFASQTPSVSGAMNGASPNPVTNAQFTSTLSGVLHRPAVFAVPEFALRLAMGEVAPHLLESQRVIPDAATQLGFQFEFPSLEDCLEAIVNARTTVYA